MSPLPGYKCFGDHSSTCLKSNWRNLGICGDSSVDAGESCDDGNVVSSDGCDSTCQIEAFSTCPTPPTGGPCTVCGEGIWDGGETCDDGNNLANDGCSPTCTIEPFSSCSGGLGVLSTCRICGYKGR